MQYYNYDIERANLHPRKAAKLRAKWNRIAEQQKLQDASTVKAA